MMFYTNTSRNSILIPGLAFLFLIINVFPKRKKGLLIIIGGSIFVTVASMTIYKSFYSGGVNLTVLTNYISTYVLGPKEIAIGFEAIIDYGSNVTISTFFNDMFGNVPIISGLTDSTNRTGQFYNYAYYAGRIVSGGGYIIPSYIQGAFYIGKLLAPIFTLFTRLDN